MTKKEIILVTIGVIVVILVIYSIVVLIEDLKGMIQRGAINN
jgi:hypothetical protein